MIGQITNDFEASSRFQTKWPFLETFGSNDPYSNKRTMNLGVNIPHTVDCFEQVGNEDGSESSASNSEDYSDKNLGKDGTGWLSSPCSEENFTASTSLGGLKQSLKDKIKFRRESEGAEEIKGLFEPPKEYKLTAEEEEKIEIRKQRNRKSATKSRLKRIERENNLVKENEKLEGDNFKLREEVRRLQTLKNFLQQVQKCMKHAPKCKSKDLHFSSVLPMDKPSGSRSNHLHNGVQLQLTGTSTNAARTFEKLENAHMPLQNVVDNVLKRKNDHTNFYQPFSGGEISAMASDCNVEKQEVETINASHVTSNENSLGKFGVTCPLQLSHEDTSMCMKRPVMLTADVTVHSKRSQFSIENSNPNPDLSTRNCRSVKEFTCSVDNIEDPVSSLATVSDDGNLLQIRDNKCTSSKPQKFVPGTADVQTLTYGSDISPLATCDLRCLLGESLCNSSANVKEIDEDGKARINYIKDHLFDDLPKNIF